MKINGKTYVMPVLDFDAVCDLEERGIDLMNLNGKNPKIATMVRGIVAWTMDCDVKTAGRELSAHLSNGESLTEIMQDLNFAIDNSGFFNQGGKQPLQIPQKQTNKKPYYNKNNGNRSQK